MSGGYCWKEKFTRTNTHMHTHRPAAWYIQSKNNTLINKHSVNNPYESVCVLCCVCVCVCVYVLAGTCVSVCGYIHVYMWGGWVKRLMRSYLWPFQVKMNRLIQDANGILVHITLTAKAISLSTLERYTNILLLVYNQSSLTP